MSDSDREANRFSARAARYARVGANMGGVAARMAGSRLFGGDARDASNAAVLAQALGGLKGPIMKVAQLLATIPDLIPPEYAAELQKLQSEAPPMGAAFVQRRMQAELGPQWQGRFGSFDLNPAAAASLGQVHRAATKDGEKLACKLQYPDMQSAVEADLKQLEWVFAVHRRMDPAIDTREIAQEIGERVREELDYEREAKHAALYARTLADVARAGAPLAGALIATGGETARAVLLAMGVRALTVDGELEPGVALTRTDGGLTVITKAGAFGDRGTLLRAARRLGRGRGPGGSRGALGRDPAAGTPDLRPDAALPRGRGGGHPGRPAAGGHQDRPVQRPQPVHHLAARGRLQQRALHLPLAQAPGC